MFFLKSQIISVDSLLRLFHTVRYLRLKQVLYRAYYAFHRQYSPAMLLDVNARKWSKLWSSPQWIPSCLRKDSAFVFLGERGKLHEASDWNNSEKSKLWLYNLHYLDELNTQGSDLRLSELDVLVNKWIAENPPPKGNGWEPYPLSLRLVNLTKWYIRHPSPNKHVLRSIQQQACVLMSKLEYHLLANHLFANGKGLVFAGVLLSAKHGNGFLKKGLSILDNELSEQFLTDGGHFELSPMYHATLMWDICDLIRLADISGVVELKKRRGYWQSILKKGLYWLRVMLHPDEQISFFNDATFEIAPTYTDLSQFSQLLGITPNLSSRKTRDLSLTHLKESGYISVKMSQADKVIIDVAKVGADYQPGHAHADTLSFELSLFNQRILVNSGISQYGNDTERKYQRSTQAHNTLVVDGKNSSDVWGGFRVGRRASPQNLHVREFSDKVTVTCAHNGYNRPLEKVTHKRQWDIEVGQLIITDQLFGKYKRAEVYFYFHPDIRILLKAHSQYQISLPEGQEFFLFLSENQKAELNNSTWHPAFGLSIPNQCLKITMNGRSLKTILKW